jgi:MFS family permease
MATTAAARSGRNSANLLVLLLGTAVLLNYIDRGAIGIAAPVMTRELRLSPQAYGLVFSAFFWVYAPVQLFSGWLCDRFSVYKLMAAGILIWAASTLLTGLSGGFVSLLVLRVMLGVGESISFPGSTKIIARHVGPEKRGIANAFLAMGIALGPAIGTLAGGLMLAAWGWRAMFVVFGTVTLLWLVPWLSTVRRLTPEELTEAGAPVPLRALIGRWSLWSMAIVHALGNYCFYFLLAWLPSFLVKSRGFSIGEMTLLPTVGYAVQAVCAFSFGHFSDWWTRSGRPESFCRRWMMVASQSAAAIAILGLSFAHTAVAIALWVCLAGAASAALSMNLYAVAQMFAGPKAAGTWVGFQNALGNSSGIFGPILTGFIVQHAGYDTAFVVTAVIAAAGSVWWAFGVPTIEQIELN